MLSCQNTFTVCKCKPHFKAIKYNYLNLSMEDGAPVQKRREDPYASAH